MPGPPSCPLLRALVAAPSGCTPPSAPPTRARCCSSGAGRARRC